MDARTFLKTLGLGIGTLALYRHDALANDYTASTRTLLKAKVLKKGDTVGLIAPAGVLDTEESISIAKEIFSYFGLRVKEGQHIRERYGNMAGTDEQRLSDLHAMFADKDVHAIVCMRGGNGASRLLSKVDYDLIAQNPKVLLGYSDVTALLLAFYTKVGLVSFHGVVGVSTWSNYVAGLFRSQFFDNEKAVFKNPGKADTAIVQYKDRVQTIHPGIAEGVLLGGNLTLLTGLCGSEFLPDFTDAILFLEEVGEKSDRMDRMLCQLMNAGVLGKIKGFIFGKCTNCGPTESYGSLTLEQLFADYIKPLGIPAYSGAMIGHISDQFLLPVGVKVRMDASLGTIEYLEQALL